MPGSKPQGRPQGLRANCWVSSTRQPRAREETAEQPERRGLIPHRGSASGAAEGPAWDRKRGVAGIQASWAPPPQGPFRREFIPRCRLQGRYEQAGLAVCRAKAEADRRPRTRAGRAEPEVPSLLSWDHWHLTLLGLSRLTQPPSPVFSRPREMFPTQAGRRPRGCFPGVERGGPRGSPRRPAGREAPQRMSRDRPSLGSWPSEAGRAASGHHVLTMWSWSTGRPKRPL